MCFCITVRIFSQKVFVLPRTPVWYRYLPYSKPNPNIDDLNTDDSTVIGGGPNNFGENGKNSHFGKGVSIRYRVLNIRKVGVYKVQR